MRERRRWFPLLLLAALSAPVGAASDRPGDPTLFPNLAQPVDAGTFDKPTATVTQERMTLHELTRFFDTVDRGVPVRLVYKNGSEYAGTYSGSETGKAAILCKKGMTPAEEVPLDAVTDAFVFVTAAHLVRIQRIQ